MASRLYIIPILVFSLVFAICSYVFTSYKRLAEQEQQILMSEIIANQGSIIERRLSRSLSSTYILASLLRQNNGQLDDFESYAADIIQSLGGISNLQLAPDGIVNSIYPLAGQERALGHDILHDDARRDVAWQAIETGRLTLAGPFELVQGGVAVIGRNPIFLNDETGEAQFWGFASALIYLKDLLASTDLDSLPQKGYTYQLMGTSPITGDLEIYAGEEAPLVNPVKYSIKVPNAEWTLCLSRESSIPSFAKNLFVLLNLSISILLAYLTYILVKQPVVLKELVRQRTDDLEKLAFYDPLTSLCNRRLFNDHIERMINHIDRSGENFALLYLDIDNFKRINDSLGHEAGDILLVSIAERLKSILRKSNIIARLGGDEFCILAANWKSIHDVRVIAEKIIKAFDEPILLENRKTFVTPSIGISIAREDGDNVSDLLRRADMAMYVAKESGKNAYRFFNDKMNNDLSDRIEIEHSLTVALDDNQFVLHYQPIVDLRSGRVVSVEALVRWQHPRKGLIYPDKFISVCEKTGLMVPLGCYVLRQACKDRNELAAVFSDDIKISVNLSQRQFQDHEMIDTFAQILSETKVTATQVELELTESMLMEKVGESIELMHELKDMGFSLAIDDFGTGYSSLSKLKSLPIDTLKIDREFIMDLGNDPEGDQLVEAIIAMADKLNLEVIAEGIEEEKQSAFLLNSGCSKGQGYYYSKPKSIEQLHDWQLPMAG